MMHVLCGKAGVVPEMRGGLFFLPREVFVVSRRIKGKAMKSNKSSPDMAKRDSRGRFVKGSIGNPKGRPVGATCRALRLAREAAERVALPRLIEAAESGDMDACKVLVSYGLPRQKPVEFPEPVNLTDGSIGEQARAVLAEVAGGRLSIEAGARLLEALKAQSQIMMTSELEARIAALEVERGKDAKGTDEAN